MPTTKTPGRFDLRDLNLDDIIPRKRQEALIELDPASPKDYRDMADQAGMKRFLAMADPKMYGKKPDGDYLQALGAINDRHSASAAVALKQAIKQNTAAMLGSSYANKGPAPYRN